MDEYDFEGHLKRISDRPKQVYQGLTRDGLWWFNQIRSSNTDFRPSPQYQKVKVQLAIIQCRIFCLPVCYPES